VIQVALQQMMQTARREARNLVLGLVGVGLVAIGAGFLVNALWTVLAEHYDAKIASLVIGGLFTGFGLIAMSLRRSKDSAAATAPPRTETAPSRHPFGPGGAYPALMDAFLLGVTTYLQIRQARPRR